MTVETGRLAKQAAGAALVSYGETVVLVTATSAKPREGIDFFPLTVDFVEKTSAAGKIPGGFFKREGRLSDREVLVSRFIDRSIRPLFADGYRDETQITATVLSADGQNFPDIAAFVGASAALTLSDIPFLGPIGAVRVARIDGQLVANPLKAQMEKSDLELIVAGSRDGPGDGRGRDARSSPRPSCSKRSASPIANCCCSSIRRTSCDAIAGRPKREVPAAAGHLGARSAHPRHGRGPLSRGARIREKMPRYAAIAVAESAVVETIAGEFQRAPGELRQPRGGRDAAQRAEPAGVADQELPARPALRGGARAHPRRTACASTAAAPPTSGRSPASCASCRAPTASALFTRGETQALVSTTLGSADDKQTIDSLTERYEKGFMLHYNFPPFSVGEARPLRGPGRREVGHGTLAEKAIANVLPPEDEFPYTVRVVAETLESNGSSSMATVCGATLALMDAGVPIKAPVAGIAMGLIEDGERVAILSDILGDEDHLGDMDFKVAGTRKGVTAVQMDIKVRSVDWAVMERALEQARAGRLHILDCMEAETRDVLGGRFEARAEVASHAPRMSQLRIKPDRIRDVIGPGGRVIRAIQEATGAKIDIEDNGEVKVFAPDRDQLERARAMIEELTQEAEIGRVYLGKVKRIADFGAFVEIFPGTDGMIHISHLAEGRVEKVTDVLDEGDEVLAKCIDIDPSGRIRLSRKEALADLAAQPQA